MAKRISILSLPFLLFSSCGGIETILFDPHLTPKDFCEIQPCVEIGGQTLIQPTSSILVFVLAFAYILASFKFFKMKQYQPAGQYWGWMLLIGGIGAILAGISYQSFGYMIKCAGRQQCVWTSYWELIYNITTVAGIGFLLMAIAHSCYTRNGQKISLFCAIVNFVVYLGVLWYGLQTANRFFLSFEMMLLFVLPIYIVVILLTIVQYLKQKTAFLKKLLIAWVILLLTLGSYYGYLLSGATANLWQQGIWFSENDVLHIGMFIWVIYIWNALGDNEEI